MKTSLLLLILGLIISGCSEFMPSDGRYTVEDVEVTRNYTKYHIVQVKGRGHAYLKDSVGKYCIGDTLKLVPQN